MYETIPRAARNSVKDCTKPGEGAHETPRSIARHKEVIPQVILSFDCVAV